MAERGRKILIPAVLLTVAALVFSLSVVSGQGPEPRPEKLNATLLGMVHQGPNESSDFLSLSDKTEPGYRRPAVVPSRAFRANLLNSTYSDEDDSVGALIKTNGSLNGLDNLGVVIQSVVGSVVAARIPLDSLLQLTSLPNVEYIEASHKLSLSNDISVPTTGASGFHDLGIDGSGVIVAVIDTGVDFTHDDFRNTDTTTRIKFICDQTDAPQSGDGTCPGNGTSNGGTLWTESQINAALTGSGTVRQVDTSGHGTHVLGSAAGNNVTFGGMAPGADIIMVKSAFFTTDIINAMSFIDQKAAELGKPYVINMSFGGHLGPHDGTDLISQAIEDLVGPGKPGKAVVASAGNGGNDIIHADGSVSSGTQTVDFTVTSGTTNVILDIWYDGSDSFSFNFVAPNTQTLINPNRPGDTVSECFSGFCVTVTHTLTLSNNDSKEILFSIVPDSGSTINLTGTYSITLTGDIVTDGGFDAWIADCDPIQDCQFTSSHGNTNSTVSRPGVGLNEITVGSYTTTKDCWASQVGSRCYFPLPTVGDISSFSSKGPTRDGRSKPDIAGPGENIASALSVNTSPIPDLITPGGEHSIRRGTSMASPHVAGAVALLLAEDPTLDAAQIKAIIQGRATKDGFTGGSCNNTWGCGKLNIVPPVDLSLTKGANSTTVLVGETVTFTLIASNDNAVVAPNVTVTDVLPGNLEFSSASAGCSFDSNSSTVTCSLGSIGIGATATSTISVLPSAPGTFSNMASVASGGTTLDTASISITATPAVTLTNVASLETVFVGEPVSFALSATNVGASTSTAVTIADVLPQNLEFSSASSGCSFNTSSRTVTCILGDLSAGEMATSTVVASPSAVGTLTSQATVTSDNPVSGSTQGSAATAITAAPALSMNMTASPSSVNVGDSVTFTLGVTKFGASTSTVVTIIDSLPAESNFASASPECSFNSEDHEVTCLLGDLSIGAMATSTVVVITTTPGSIDNQATVTSSDPIPGSTHSTASSSVAVSPANQPPTVDAGPDQIITLPASANLAGTATDDGLIQSPLILTWSMVTGAGLASFDDNNLGNTNVTFTTDGLYVLKLVASDGELSASDELTIDVRPEIQQTSTSSGGGGGGGARITPVIAFRPEEPLVFTAIEGEENPEPQILRVWTSKNRSVLRFNVTSDVPWLTLDPSEGLSDDPGDKERITLSAVTSGLRAGIYEGKVVISARKAKNDPQEVSVTLILEEPLPSEPSELAEKIVGGGSLEVAVETFEKMSISDAVNVVEELDGDKAADLLSELSSATAGIILGDLTESTFATILVASDINELEEALSEMSSEAFIAASKQLGVRNTLLIKLPRVSADQLFPERSPQADPALALPVASKGSGSVTTYNLAKTSDAGWTTLVASPATIERVVAKFSRELEDIDVQVETLEQIPEDMQDLSSGQVVNSLFSVDIGNVNADEITVAHVTLAIEKDWLEVNEIHRWSIKLNRFDEQLGKWVAFPTRRISEDAEKILYTAAVPGFSVFAVTGSKYLFEPVLEVIDLRVTPTSPIEGQDIRVIAAVRNIGVEDAVFPASLWVDDLLEDSQTVLVRAGETEEVTFKIGKLVGKHRIRVDRLVGEFEVRPSVRLEQSSTGFSTPALRVATSATPTAIALAVATPAPPTPIATPTPPTPLQTVGAQPTATSLPTLTPEPTATAATSAVPVLPRAPAPPSQPPVESGAPSTIDEEGGIGTVTLIILIIVGIAVLAGIAVGAHGLRVRRRQV